jgi:hypothetical protein
MVPRRRLPARRRLGPGRAHVQAIRRGATFQCVDERWRTIRIGPDQLADLSEEMGGPVPHPLQSFVMPLVVTTEEDGRLESMQILGSAFCVGTLLMTAKHVLEPFYVPETGLVDTSQRLYAISSPTIPRPESHALGAVACQSSRPAEVPLMTSHC